MKQRLTSQNVSAYIFLIGGTVATLYLLFIFANALWQAQQKERLFLDFRQEIQRLEEENKTLDERFALQETEQFLDKYAKSNLGKVNPGEKVIVLSEPQAVNPFDFEGMTAQEIEKELLKSRRIPEQWWYFFFER